MSPTLNGSSALQCFKPGKAVKNATELCLISTCHIYSSLAFVSLSHFQLLAGEVLVTFISTGSMVTVVSRKYIPPLAHKPPPAFLAQTLAEVFLSRS